jgi:uncharacterized membrane protein (UPF0127 family)
VVALVAVSCGGGEVATTSTSIVSATTTAADPLAAFEVIEVTVGGEAWAVALADTPALRSQGLMGVIDLGGLDGMLFSWPGDTASGFWMKDTLIPLDVAFFSVDGSLVDLLSMVPCEEDPCPSYRSSGAYRFALEAPLGGFKAFDPAALGLDL